jgi:hypothetical protein
VDKTEAPTKCVGAELTQFGHFGGAQQLDRPMPEEVRRQYESAVTKPLGTVLSLSQTLPELALEGCGDAKHVSVP